MSRCQCKVGFFALRACPELALGQCATCGRLICAAHVAQGSALEECRDCWARKLQDEQVDSHRPGSDPRYDDDWADSHRRRYYSWEYSQRYSDTGAPADYDRDDARSLVADERDLDGDEGVPPGFGDS